MSRHERRASDACNGISPMYILSGGRSAQSERGGCVTVYIYRVERVKQHFLHIPAEAINSEPARKKPFENELGRQYWWWVDNSDKKRKG